MVDSTGIMVEGEGEWRGAEQTTVRGTLSCGTRKHGGAKRRVWRLVQLGTDNKTLEIRAAEFPGGDVGDGPMLPDRLKRIPFHLEIGRVRADTADGALGTRKCHDATARARQAVMPPRKNATPWKPDTAGAAARNKPCARHGASGSPSGDDGADTPPQPRRHQEALREAAGPAPHRELIG